MFPISGLRLPLPRAEAAERATRFLQQMEVQIPPGYTRATRFAINSAAKSYLEQQLGNARANQVAQTEGFVYFWYRRWFRPGSEREPFVAIDPEGRVLSFSDRLPIDAPALPSRRPRRVAERFISEVVGVDLRAYRLLGKYQTSPPNRVDYSYVWERTDLRLAEATQRIGLTVTGNRVISFMRYLHFPERFTHTFRSSDVFLYNTEWLPCSSFGVALLFLLLPAALAWRWSRQPETDSSLTPATNDAVDTSPLVGEEPVPPAEVFPEREVVFPTLGLRRLWSALLALGMVLGMGFGWYALQEGQKRFD